MSPLDIAGERYGYLVAIKRTGTDKTGRYSMWLCKCDCGNYCTVKLSLLRSGKTSSCGCKVHESRNFTHKMSKTRLYHEWCSMRRRCISAQGKDYKSYQGIGISVCAEWNADFVSFYDWAMANGYNDNLTIDRIDVNKGYSPENCRWISIGEQQSNKRNTVHVFYEGKEWCLRTLCQNIGFPYSTAWRRYNRLKKRGEEITPEKLFKPIETEKISFRYR